MAKATLVEALRLLSGWHAEPERKFEADGEAVIADVYAHNESPAAHQQPTLWEIQLSPEPYGRLVERTTVGARIVAEPEL